MRIKIALRETTGSRMLLAAILLLPLQATCFSAQTNPKELVVEQYKLPVSTHMRGIAVPWPPVQQSLPKVLERRTKWRSHPKYTASISDLNGKRKLFVGGSTLTIRKIQPKNLIQNSSGYHYAVFDDEQNIISVFAPHSPTGGLKAFFSIGSAWVLEYAGRSRKGGIFEGSLIVNGSDIGAKKGYDEVFCAQPIRGRLFYFFRERGIVRMAYDGHRLKQQYDDVAHYYCCDPYQIVPKGNDNMIWFYARKGDSWYYVEAGFYNENVAEMQ